MANNIFGPNSDQRCRSYSVTPLSGRTGLIEWIGEASSVYQIYRSWHHKTVGMNLGEKDVKQGLLKFSDKDLSNSFIMMTAHSDQHKESQMSTNSDQHSFDNHEAKQVSGKFRPVDKFYALAAELFPDQASSKNLHKSRKNWTSEMFMKLVTEMEKDSPSDLISGYLRSNSKSSVDWWKRVKTYNRSLAVSSMVGSIMDLGDRHLDNILIDVNSGEVIHVDFNVCFHKGKRLRIPERVPFRLTKNFVSALGPTGIDVSGFTVLYNKEKQFLRVYSEKNVFLRWKF